VRILHRRFKMLTVVLVAAALSAPAFGQQSTIANSVWNGGEGPWISPINWVTNGTLGLAIPNNGDMVICNVDESCEGYFNVSIGTGGNDLVTLDSLPVTIDSLALGASTGNAALDIGSAVADTLTIGDPTAPNGGAAASLTVNSTGFLNVFAGSKLNLNIAAGNGTLTNNGTIDLEAASGAGSSLLINDAGNAHQLTLSGTGTLTLEAGSVIQGVTGDEGLINGSTIQGGGTISNLALLNSGPNGEIVAEGTLTITPNANAQDVAGVGPNVFGLLNSGTLTAASGGTLIVNLSQSHAADFPLANLGVIDVDGGGTLEFVGLASATTNLTNYGGGQINVGGAGAGGTLKLDGTDATFDLGTGGSGTGTLTLSDNANNLITGVTGTETLINDVGETLSGAGTIKNLALVNNGTIIASGTNALNIIPNSHGFTNNGTLQVNSGSTLNLSGTTTSTNSASVLVNGTLNVTSGSTLNAVGLFNQGNIHVSSGGELLLNATAVPNGTANLGTIVVGDGGKIEAMGAAGATVSLGNVIDLGNGDGGGVIDVGGAGAGGKLQFSGSNTTFDLNNIESSINGVPAPGALMLSDNPNNLITGVTGTETFINDSGETLSGAGTIENLALVNKGTIVANDTDALNINPVATGSNTAFSNSGTIDVDSGSTLKATLTNGASGTGLSNSGTITIAKGGTFLAGLANTTAGTGFSNSGTINVDDGGRLEFQDLKGGTTVNIDDYQGNINLGQSTGATLLLNDGGAGATFHLFASSGSNGIGMLTMVNSTIEGVSGDETLLLDFSDTIEGTGSISHLKLTSAPSNFSQIIANGGTLKINATLTNLSDGTLKGGEYQAGDTASGILQLPGNVTTNSAFLDLDGKGSEITDPAGNNALSGLTSISNGVLGLSDGASLSISGSLADGNTTSSGLVNIALENAATLTIAGNLTNSGNVFTGLEGAGGSTLHVGGTLTNSGTLDLIGSGDKLNVASLKNAANVSIYGGATVTVAAGGTYTQTAGSTDAYGTLISPTVSATGGTFSDDGIVETKTLTDLASITTDSTGFIGVGSGTFSATRGYQELGSGTLDELISGKSTFGTIDITGPASLNGTLDVTLENGFVPTVGEQFAFLDFTKGDLSGTFANFLGQTFDNGKEQWVLSYNKAGGDLLLTAEAPTSNAALFSTGPSSSSGSGTAAPEPSSLLLFGTALLGLGFLVRRKKPAVP
jgi:fibronectin-binding autotransporter adhesin